MKKELPYTENVNTCDLFGLPYKALEWELLKTAVELKLFDYLSTPVTSQEISSALSLHSANTEYVLNGLVALGCLTKKEDRFSNTAVAETYLTSEKDTSIGDSILFMAQWIIPVLNGGLKNLLRAGPPTIRENIADGELWKQGALASLNLSRCGRAQSIARLISELPEFKSFSRMLDMGAGPGIIGIAVASKKPDLECILFDQQAVCDVAEAVIKEYGMEDRVQAVSGSYMEDDIGNNYDLIMANFTLNFYRDRLDKIMQKVLNALNPGGVFMVSSDGMSRDGTAPPASVLSWLPTMLQGQDMSFQSGVIARAMLDSGFISTQCQTLTDIQIEAHGPVEMTIGRKEIK